MPLYGSSIPWGDTQCSLYMLWLIIEGWGKFSPQWCGKLRFLQGSTSFYVCWPKTKPWLGIIWQKGDMWRIKHACFAMNWKQPPICSLNVVLLLNFGPSSLRWMFVPQVCFGPYGKLTVICAFRVCTGQGSRNCLEGVHRCSRTRGFWTRRKRR